jgi:hypothetical protein
MLSVLGVKVRVDFVGSNEYEKHAVEDQESTSRIETFDEIILQ